MSDYFGSPVAYFVRPKTGLKPAENLGLDYFAYFHTTHSHHHREDDGSVWGYELVKPVTLALKPAEILGFWADYLGLGSRHQVGKVGTALLTQRWGFPITGPRLLNQQHFERTVQ